MTTRTTPQAGTASRPARPDASMTLLVEVMERPLDPGYAEAAERRRAASAAGRPERRSRAGLVLLALVAVLLGLMTAAAARQLRVPQEGVAAARNLLEEQIVERNGEAERLQARAVALDASIEELQRETLATQNPGLLNRLRLDGLANGTSAVQGPGLVVTLADGGSDGLTSQDADPNSRVGDADVQRVVNALWASGAEAVAVDDQRLTPLSAIRNAGDAILVDLVPLTGPTYVVSAVGDPQAMQSAYARSDAPAYLQLLASGYGIESSVTTDDELALPGMGTPTLRHAEVLTDEPAEPASDTVTENSTPDVSGAQEESQ